jgi:hypothetical protein
MCVDRYTVKRILHAGFSANFPHLRCRGCAVRPLLPPELLHARAPPQLRACHFPFFFPNGVMLSARRRFFVSPRIPHAKASEVLKALLSNNLVVTETAGHPDTVHILDSFESVRFYS